jgi:eukaryotic-like serine/threonine-protein kinase
LPSKITHPGERTAFLDRAVASGVRPGSHAKPAPAPRSGDTPASGARFAPTPVAMERARKLLAEHLGPIASVVVKNAAAKSADHAQFCRTLADAAPAAVREALFGDLLKSG